MSQFNIIAVAPEEQTYKQCFSNLFLNAAYCCLNWIVSSKYDTLEIWLSAMTNINLQN